MNIEQFYEFCLSLGNVTEHMPFDKDTLVFKVNNKMFVLTSLKGWETGSPSVNVKCVPELATGLREQYKAVEPGYHMNKKHWNTISINTDMSTPLVLEQIKQSYELVAKKGQK